MSARELMPPPAPRPPRPAPRVLEEDEFTLHLEEIVERDFFPDLPRLRNRLDWLTASRSGDAATLAAAQLRIQERTLGRTPYGGALATPSIGTPHSGSATPRAAADEGHRAAALAAALAAAAAAQDDPSALRLDAFLTRYTSEDNASFAAQLETVNAARRAQPRAAAAIAASAAHAAHTAAMRLCADGQRTEVARLDGFGSSGQPYAGVQSAAHALRPALFYPPEPLALPPADAFVAAAAREAGLVADNTRLRSGRGREAPLADPPAPRRYTPVATPSMTPGVGASPLMTWGRLDATPLRLEATAEELAALDSRPNAPAFTIAPVGARDALGLALAVKAGLRGVTPRRSAHSLPAVRARTPGGGRDDWALRQSYTPHATPRGTPAVSRGATPAATPARKRGRDEGLTDGLLKL